MTFRGLPIGRVERILMSEINMVDVNPDIPVLIYLEPGRFEFPDTAESLELIRGVIMEGVRDGMRATLRTGSLLTGRQTIAFDFYPDAPAEDPSEFLGYTKLPTFDAGFERIADQTSALLAKLNDLPLDQTVAGANNALADVSTLVTNLNTAVSSLQSVLGSPELQALPGELNASLTELRGVLSGFSEDATAYQDLSASLGSLDRTLNNLDRLSAVLAERPSALLVAPAMRKDPEPKARR